MKGSKMPTVYHVAVDGDDDNVGTSNQPLRSINNAARLARPGDTVIVHQGEYRECVQPRAGGLSDQRRITYTAAPGENVVIKGSELVTGWERVDGTIWKVILPNRMFGEFNPFRETVYGDWLVRPRGAAPPKHLGEVYLNGKSLYEADSITELEDPPLRSEINDDNTGVDTRIETPGQTRLVWHAQVLQEETILWANFQGADPKIESVEINVRRSIFYPVQQHINYITVRGFELAHAASPWAPPTADQPGLIGPNWAKEWIIEDNIIHDAKCVAISIGKEASTGHNYSELRGDKPGYQYQLESVFTARQIGWDREHIGSHIIRRNTIYNCGQSGIVGHLGGIYSTIEGNHIYNIGIKREFYGHEIAGIKLHAAIDAIIQKNRIHNCTLGSWLDWQTQGTRVSRNVYYGNRRDLFIEVSHGPYVVDHNILSSPVSLEIMSQGGAFVNNLICGAIATAPMMERPTPYHLPHSTQVAGYAAIYGGDDRYIANLFVGRDDCETYSQDRKERWRISCGTSNYSGHPGSVDEFFELVGEPGVGDHERFLGVEQPVYVRDNVYGGDAEPYGEEQRSVVLSDHPTTATVVDEGAEVYLETDLPAEYDATRIATVTGDHLPHVRLVGADFEDSNGDRLVVATDITGFEKEVGSTYAAGPIAFLQSGTSRVRVWSP